jgi:hypothetical protein
MLGGLLFVRLFVDIFWGRNFFYEGNVCLLRAFRSGEIAIGVINWNIDWTQLFCWSFAMVPSGDRDDVGLLEQFSEALSSMDFFPCIWLYLQAIKSYLHEFLCTPYTPWGLLIRDLFLHSCKSLPGGSLGERCRFTVAEYFSPSCYCLSLLIDERVFDLLLDTFDTMELCMSELDMRRDVLFWLIRKLYELIVEHPGPPSIPLPIITTELPVNTFYSILFFKLINSCRFDNDSGFFLLSKSN